MSQTLTQLVESGSLDDLRQQVTSRIHDEGVAALSAALKAKNVEATEVCWLTSFFITSMQILLSAGVSLGLADGNGLYPIEQVTAAEMSRRGGRRATAQPLQTLRVVLKYNPGPEGFSPSIRLAASQGRHDIVSLLFDHCKRCDLPIDLENIDKETGNTALLSAISYHDTKAEMVSLLLQSGANANAINSRGNTCLHKLATKTDLKEEQKQMVEMLIEKGAQLAPRNAQGDTPLIKAARQGNTSLIRLLLPRMSEEQVIIYNQPGYTAAHEASIWCQSDVISLLAEKFPGIFSVGDRDNGDLPLHLVGDEKLVGKGFYLGETRIAPINRSEAEAWGSINGTNYNAVVETVRNILKAGNDPKQRNQKGATTFHRMSVPWCKIETLLENCEDKFGALTTADHHGNTPFLNAVQLGRVEHVQRMLQCISGNFLPKFAEDSRNIGANEITWESTRIRELIQSLPAFTQHHLGDSANFLRNACRMEENSTLVEVLLREGGFAPLINHRDERGATAVHAAAESNCSHVLRILLEHGGDPHIEAVPAKKTYQVKQSVVDTMLKDAASNITDLPPASDFDTGRIHRDSSEPLNALLTALYSLSTHTLLILLKHMYKDNQACRTSKDANILRDFTDSSGSSLLHRAVADADVESLSDLLQWTDMDVNTCKTQVDAYADGGTPLHTAAQNDQLRCAEVLVEAGADVNNVSNYEANSPLHVAARFGSSSVLRLLLERGADVSLLNQEGEDAMDLAAYGDSEECMTLLREAKK
ncbi:hypothetical protein PROFUN_01907 [Planoprotostelium fungivorum]|uniref:Uncharacterized protein n=1 Tax=Planoprotostelium fungivorum TaxID=1890364 RepID=A0A2P6NZ04_9EUKA|nr:hypothetical protein PROFUN_01907 [Planoprotostelium fungivorum]